MSVHKRQNGLSLPRLLMLALALFGLLAQPVLATVGEAHELQHGSLAGHGLDLHAAHADQQPPAAAGHEDAGRDNPAAHVLMHFAHCCAASVVLPAAAALLASAELPAAPGAPHHAFVPDEPAELPFKPPIEH